MINITIVNNEANFAIVTGTVLNDLIWRDYLASSLDGLFGALECRRNANGLEQEVNRALPAINNQIESFTIRLPK